MASRKDQAQAYFFVVGRLIAGLLNGDPDALQRPNRRPSVGTAIGVLILVLILGAFGIYGLLRPGGSSVWKTQTGNMILVKETGARYLLVDGQLRPVLNYASARLVLGNGAPVTTVSRDSLSGVPIGSPIGIPGAPDALPSASHLYTGPWTVCARPGVAGQRTRTTVVLGDVTAVPVSDAQAMLVSTVDGSVFLVWRGHRHRLGSAAVALALGYGRLEPMPVTPGWINPVPSGPDLSFPAIAGRGQAGPTLGGRSGVVGQVYEVRNPALATSDLYLLRADGLALLSRTVAALILADPATKAAYGEAAIRPVPATADEVATAGVRDRTTLVSGYPPNPPEAVNDTGADLPCLRHSADGTATMAGTLTPASALTSAVPLAGLALTGTTADEVMVAAGAGLIARNRAAPGTAYLVSEAGVKFPIADENALSALGYAGAAAAQVSGELLALLPTGPVLSAAAALAGQPVGS